MEVTLLTHSSDCQRTVAFIEQLTHDNQKSYKQYNELTDEDIIKNISEAIKQRDSTALNYIHFVFLIRGISRRTIEKLSLFRPAVKNKTKYDFSELNFSMPTSIVLNPKKERPTAKEMFLQLLSSANNVYKFLTKTCGISQEDAQAIVPLCMQNDLVFLLTAKDLYRIFASRCHSSGEYRELIDELKKSVKKAEPEIFSNVGDFCDMYGYCLYNSSSCGKKPTINTLLKSYKLLNKGDDKK